MRIAELREREDYDTVFQASLGRALSDLLGHPVHVEAAQAGGQVWRVQELLSAYYVDGVVEPARHFLAETLRFTRDPLRMVPQAAFATVLASAAGLRTFGKPAFSLRPGLPDARFWVILPGNRRIRLFNFATGITRVVAKVGVDGDVLAREVQFRQQAGEGPFLPISAASPARGWFEEPILDASPLSRLPPWLEFRKAEGRALDALEAFTAPRRAPRARSDYFAALASAITAAGVRLSLGEPVLQAILGRIHRLDRVPGDLLVGPSHGDCQAGNALVERSNGRVTWTDWEFQAPRSEFYDRVVYGLRLRWPTGLSERVLAVLAGRFDPILGLPVDAAARRDAVAIAIAEDIALVLEARASNGLSGTPSTLAELLLALDLAGSR